MYEVPYKKVLILYYSFFIFWKSFGAIWSSSP